MMVRMGQFVQNHPRLAMCPPKEIFSIGYLDTAFLLRIEVIFPQPSPAWMVAHAGMTRGLILDPDWNATQLLKRLSRHDSCNLVKLLLQQF